MNERVALCVPGYSCIRDWTYGGEGNITTNPGLLTDVFVPAGFLDNFNRTTLGGDWTCSGGWTLTSGYLHAPSWGGLAMRDQPNDNMSLWLSYRRTGGTVDFYLRRITGSLEAVILRFCPYFANAMASLIEVDADGNPSTVASVIYTPESSSVWYELYIRLESGNAEVWKGERGKGMTLIFTYSDSQERTEIDGDISRIQTTASFDFDNIRFANNWREFLHLADENSPCVDMGYPKDKRYGAPGPKVRDFDDEVGPIDGNDVGEDDPNVSPVRREIGADEFTSLHPGSYIYWWENLSVEGP